MAEGEAGATESTEVDLSADFRESGVAEVLDQLDRELIGLKPVKQRIRDISALLVIDRLRRNLGLQAQNPSLHMCFTGNPGTAVTCTTPPTAASMSSCSSV